MRNILLAIFCAMTSQSFSQNFEGIITWSMKTEFTDPARKAEMAQNMRTAQDQITYAKLKAMAAQNDPQYKKMMEDPKMKAEMEKAMRMQTTTLDGLTLTVKIKDHPKRCMCMSFGQLDHRKCRRQRTICYLIQVLM